MASGREEKVTVADCTVRMLRGGEGPPMLYLHGAGGIAGWAPFMDGLAGSFDLHVPEHPGFGDTEDPDWLDTIHDEAYFYLSLLETLDLRGVHLVGMSIGGWIALEMAVRNTGRIATLTVCGASGIHVKGVPKGDIFMWEPEARVRNMVHDQALAVRLLAQPVTDEQQRVNLRNLRSFALLAWNPRLYDPHLHKWLRRIDVPTHVVWADDDKVLPVDYARAYERLIPGARISIIEACGHLMHIEKPVEFAETVTAFIAGAGR